MGVVTAYAPPILTRGQRLCRAAALAGAMACCLLVTIVDPSANTVPICPFRVLTGMYCPLCGSTRAAHRLGRGDIAGAASFNVLILAALPLVVYAAMSAARGLVRGRPLPALRVRPVHVWVATAILLLFGLVRNLPLPALRALAP